MTHGRKPRKPRQIRTDAFMLARNNATRLTPAEIHDIMQPVQTCARLLREGVATEDQHAALQTALQIAQAIEHSRIMRGLQEHITSALQAMEGIARRALASGGWKPTALYYQELDAITTMVDLHRHQLQAVSAGELHTIVQRLIHRHRASQTGPVVHMPAAQLFAA